MEITAPPLNSHPLEGRSVTEYYFFLLLGLRLKDLLIGLGIKPLVLLCLGFLNKMPRKTISKLKTNRSLLDCLQLGKLFLWKKYAFKCKG
jgi:hypothetical protein